MFIPFFYCFGAVISSMYTFERLIFSLLFNKVPKNPKLSQPRPLQLMARANRTQHRFAFSPMRKESSFERSSGPSMAISSSSCVSRRRSLSVLCGDGGFRGSAFKIAPSVSRLWGARSVVRLVRDVNDLAGVRSDDEENK